MGFKMITATVNVLALNQIEKRLAEIAVPGLSVTETKGYGTYKNFFQRDMMTTHARIQIYAAEERVDEIIDAIIEAGSTGADDDGVVAVSPIDAIYSVADKSEIPADNL
ncbi:P-II family nitrogen regulator [Hyphococcus sp.]|jgi:nitrogen regulatory protein P-II 1|uniref:P-II family nitrogen regulator n=1 Tax=Hyphococcus sp. TaxID=2038636 RepID=UPI003D0FD38C